MALDGKMKGMNELDKLLFCKLPSATEANMSSSSLESSFTEKFKENLNTQNTDAHSCSNHPNKEAVYEIRVEN